MALILYDNIYCMSQSHVEPKGLFAFLITHILKLISQNS